MPLATETIPEIIALIEELVDAGHAYAAGGDVYFRVASFATYGALSGHRLDQIEEQEPSPLKEDPRDFALWKATKEGEDTSWDSPWGPGRPGWHIECSAMAEKTLGPEFLIHGGGLDLVFPHHENERAQSQAVGRPFAKIWMHNGLLRFTGEKMSKSVGNVATIQEVIAEWGREAALLFLMTGHWRKPLEFSQETMTAASVQVESLRNALRGETRTVGDWDDLASVLDDDFNTPAALAVLHRWAREGALDELRRGLAVFGLGELGDVVEAPDEVVALARARRAARAARDFAESDRLRDEIAAAGWEVRDVRRRLRARAAAVTRELVYGRNAVREALRGRREVLELWVSERAAASLDWLGEGPRAAGRQGTGAHRGGSEPRSPGRRRLGEPVPVRRSVGARGRRRSRCSPASTRSPTRGTSVRSSAPQPAPARRG